MTDREERDKFLAGYVGDEWHVRVSARDRYLSLNYICSCGDYSIIDTCDATPCNKSNPDYHTAEGRQRLLEWAVKEKWWGDFSTKDGGAWPLGKSIPLSLLIPESALAEAVYKYLKEKEG